MHIVSMLSMFLKVPRNGLLPGADAMTKIQWNVQCTYVSIGDLAGRISHVFDL